MLIDHTGFVGLDLGLAGLSAGGDRGELRVFAGSGSVAQIDQEAHVPVGLVQQFVDRCGVREQCMPVLGDKSDAGVALGELNQTEGTGLQG